ncbi:hypothetical protein T03_3142 [Trichinella britovi]|uniref:Uncharacterized protein n=1 Tax=Trichinella britovi TaxID=45882 RepID=A0A0V1DAS6_TRIBR|nr:hypothetical protein T03_3142 [Trichinella britovi]
MRCSESVLVDWCCKPAVEFFQKNTITRIFCTVCSSYFSSKVALLSSAADNKQLCRIHQWPLRSDWTDESAVEEQDRRLYSSADRILFRHLFERSTRFVDLLENFVRSCEIYN